MYASLAPSFVSAFDGADEKWLYPVLKRLGFTHIEAVKDNRHQSYIEYETDILLFSVIMKNACCIDIMNGMTEKFNKDECIKNIGNVLGYCRFSN